MQHPSAFPRVDDHLVEPETRQEMVRGELIMAPPAKEPHAERHSELDYVIRGNVASGHIVATDLLTRVGPQSDFATDVCVRKTGIDPETGARYLEELAFEIINEQSMRHITVRAEDLATRGLRRLIAVFVKRGEVGEWSQAEGCFVMLPLDGMLEDPTLVQPIPIRALLEVASADDAVAAALFTKRNPLLVHREQQAREQGRQAALLLVLDSRGLHPSDEQRGVIQACTEAAQLDRWLRAAPHVSSVAELLEA